MANFEIQNHLGEVIIASVTQEELDALLEAGDYSYGLYDANPEYDMVNRLASAKEENPDLDVETFRIYKQIED